MPPNLAKTCVDQHQTRSPSVSSATVYCLSNSSTHIPHARQRTHAPEIPKRPHLKVLDVHVLLLLSQHAVFPGASSPSGSRRIRLGLRRYWRRVTSYLVAVDLLLVLPRTWRTGPAIASAGLCQERWVHASHMEELFAAVALDSLGAAKSWESFFGGECWELTVGTISRTLRNCAVHLSSRAPSLSLRQHIHIERVEPL